MTLAGSALLGSALLGSALLGSALLGKCVRVGSSGLRAFWTSLLVVGALIAASERSEADAWPDRPVKIVVAYSAGGSGDIVARALAQKLTETFGQSFYVENRPVATRNLVTDFAATPTPYGYNYSWPPTSNLRSGRISTATCRSR